MSPSRTAQASEIASSIASLVPEPIEKCAVCAASPSRTVSPSRQRSLRTVTKLIQRVRFSTSSNPNRASHVRLVERQRLRGLDDERAHRVAVGIGVDLHHAARRLGDQEGERVEDVRRAEPGVGRAAVVQRGAEAVPAQGRVHAVGRDHQVALQRGDLVPEVQLDAEFRRAGLQDPEQLLAPERAENPCPPLVMTSPRKCTSISLQRTKWRGDLGVGLRVGGLEGGQRLVGEHDAEAERVVGRVALVARPPRAPGPGA